MQEALDEILHHRPPRFARFFALPNQAPPGKGASMKSSNPGYAALVRGCSCKGVRARAQGLVAVHDTVDGGAVADLSSSTTGAIPMEPIVGTNVELETGNERRGLGGVGSEDHPIHVPQPEVQDAICHIASI